MIAALRRWRNAKVRMIQFGPAPHKPFYIRFTPNFGLSIPWFGGTRLRYARHHGLQLTRWRTDRWYVLKQIMGRSSVRGADDHFREMR